MLNSGTTLLLVSHSTEQVRRICDRAVLINKGKMLIEDDVRYCLRFVYTSLERWRIYGFK